MSTWIPATVILFLSVATPISIDPLLHEQSAVHISVHAIIPNSREFLGHLPNEAHGIQGMFYVDDHLTFSIDGFSYDGFGPEAFPYYYLRGSEPNRIGFGVIFPAEANSDRFTRAYSNEDIVLRIPANHQRTVCDIGWFTIWCRRARQFFTRIEIPETVLNCSAPTVETTPTVAETSPTTEETTQPTVTQPPVTVPTPFMNCLRLSAGLELSWTLDRSAKVGTFMLCGCVSGTGSSDNQYLGFGLSGSPDGTQMFGADATITWVDDVTGAHAEDYFLSNYVQCGPDGKGACPDELDSSGSCSNDVTVVSGTKENGLQCITYTKNFMTDDEECDIPIDPDNTQQFIVWGIGGQGERAFKHFERATKYCESHALESHSLLSMRTATYTTGNDPPLHLGRDPRDECSSAAPLVCRGCRGFDGVTMEAMEDRTFRVRIGPSGLDRGYESITGEAGWGISYFIDGELIPELVVERGRTYTFVIETGEDPEILAEYHPFYITDSISGGRMLLNQQEKANERIFAGYNFTVNPSTGEMEERPIAFGRYCEYQESPEASDILKACGSQAAYTAALVSFCKSGSVGVMKWTPDESTPDTVYYQCAVHFNLGWRITVRDAWEAGSVNAMDTGSTMATVASWLTALLVAAVTLVIRL